MSFSIAIRKRNADLGRHPGGYRRGDIVQVFPFDWPFAAGDKASHWIVRVTTPRTVGQVQEFMDNKMQDENTEQYRRIWTVLVDNVPAQIRQEMLAQGEVTVSLAAIRNFIQNRLTGATY